MSGRRISSRPPPDEATSSEEDDEGTLRSNETPRGKSKGTPSSQRQPAPLQLGSLDRDKYLGDIVFHILVVEQMKKPVKKAEVFKNVKLTGKPRDFQDQVWNQAISKLEEVFGIEMKEDPEKKGNFYLVNKFRESFDQESHFLAFSEKENASYGLLFIVLSLIFMNNGVIQDDELFNFIRKLGVYEGKFSDSGGSQVNKDVKELFGDVRNLVFNEWSKKQQYLDIKKVDTGDTDNAKFEIRWSNRAEVEVKKSDILKVVCRLYKLTNPRAFKREYDLVIEEEGEDAMRPTNQEEVEVEDEN